MASKTKSAADDKADSKSDSQKLSGSIKDSAQQIWLAGLGAFSKAQEERSKVFEALVKEGAAIQSKSKAFTEEKLSEVTDRFAKAAGDVAKQATQSWDRLEQVFEERVARSLSRLGVPTNRDIAQLITRIDELNASIKALSKKPAVTRAAQPGARKAAAKRGAGKA